MTRTIIERARRGSGLSQGELGRRAGTSQAPLSTVILPQRLHWSELSRPFLLRGRGDRARVYETVLREGEPLTESLTESLTEPLTDILGRVDERPPLDLMQPEHAQLQPWVANRQRK